MLKLVVLGLATLASADQVRFSAPSSPPFAAADSSVYRLAFPSRQALERAVSDASDRLDVWHSGYSHSSQSWELTLASERTPLGFAPLLDPDLVVPSVASLLSEPLQHPDSLASLSHASLGNLSRDLSNEAATIHDSYHPFDHVRHILDQFEAHWGPRWVRTEVIGTSWEGREIKTWKVSDYSVPATRRDDVDGSEGGGKDGDEVEEGVVSRDKQKRKKGKKGKNPSLDKVGIVIYGALHSREWISTSTIVYLIHHLLVHHKENKRVRDLLQRVEFSFIPVVNPDGYAHTWTSPSNRLWRKSRQPPRSSALHTPQFDVSDECVGIDLNKNWNHTFAPSTNPCSDSYAGSSGFEAVELEHLSKWLSKKSSKDPKERGADGNAASARVRAVLDLHSFGEQLLYPYSSDCSNPPPTAENLFECLLAGSKALKAVHGRTWQVGESCQVGIKGGGEGLDWIYDVAKIPWSFTAQLRGGVYGFLLPPTQIRASGEEFAEAVKAIAKFIVEARDPESLKDLKVKMRQYVPGFVNPFLEPLQSRCPFDSEVLKSIHAFRQVLIERQWMPESALRDADQLNRHDRAHVMILFRLAELEANYFRDGSKKQRKSIFRNLMVWARELELESWITPRCQAVQAVLRLPWGEAMNVNVQTYAPNDDDRTRLNTELRNYTQGFDIPFFQRLEHRIDEDSPLEEFIRTFRHVLEQKQWMPITIEPDKLKSLDQLHVNILFGLADLEQAQREGNHRAQRSCKANLESFAEELPPKDRERDHSADDRSDVPHGRDRPSSGLAMQVQLPNYANLVARSEAYEAILPESDPTDFELSDTAAGQSGSLRKLKEKMRDYTHGFYRPFFQPLVYKTPQDSSLYESLRRFLKELATVHWTLTHARTDDLDQAHVMILFKLADLKRAHDREEGPCKADLKAVLTWVWKLPPVSGQVPERFRPQARCDV
ncbi:hypothetical protein JCM11491_003244 [Sporobolomyces phaffii]